MGKTMRSVRSTEQDGTIRQGRQQEGATPWRADRNERLRRASRDAKRIERAERHSAAAEHETVWHTGSSVRAVA